MGNAVSPETSTNIIEDLVGAIESLGERIAALEGTAPPLLTEDQQILQGQFSLIGQLIGYGITAPVAVSLAGFDVDAALYGQDGQEVPEPVDDGEMMEMIEDDGEPEEPEEPEEQADEIYN